MTTPSFDACFGESSRGKQTFTIAGEANNGRQALDAVRELDPDVIVMDIDMPVMSGLEATLKIKRLYPDIHVLAFTGSSSSETLGQLKRAGITAVIEKTETAELVYRLNDLSAIRRGAGGVIEELIEEN